MGKKWKRILKLRRVKAARLGGTTDTVEPAETTEPAVQETTKAPAVEIRETVKVTKDAPKLKAKKATTTKAKKTTKTTKASVKRSTKK